MKKILLQGLFFTLIFLLFVSCERDDICAEATVTTPKLVIEFFDADNPGNSRNVVNLAARAIENDTALLFNSTSRISIPLKTDDIETSYVFTINALANSGGITDTLTFSYATNEIYVNRACGFKVNFLDFRARIENTDNDPGNWINRIQARENIIENESETHLFIFY